MPTKSPAQRVAQEVRAQMARSGCSQSELAKALNLSQAAISRRLTGNVPFDIAELHAAAAHLDVPVAAFLVEVAA